MQGILDFGNFLLSIFVYQWTIYNNDLAAVVWYEDRSFPIPFFFLKYLCKTADEDGTYGLCARFYVARPLE